MDCLSFIQRLESSVLQGAMLPFLDDASLARLAFCGRWLFKEAKQGFARRRTAAAQVVRQMDSLCRMSNRPLQPTSCFAPPDAGASEAVDPDILTVSRQYVLTLVARNGLLTAWPRVATKPENGTLVQPLYCFYIASLVQRPNKRKHVGSVTRVREDDYSNRTCYLVAHDSGFYVASSAHKDVHLYRWSDLPSQATAGKAADRVAVQSSSVLHGPDGSCGVAAICLAQPDLVAVYTSGSISVFDSVTHMRRTVLSAHPLLLHSGICVTAAVMNAAGIVILGTSDGHLVCNDIHASEGGNSNSSSSSASSVTSSCVGVTHLSLMVKSGGAEMVPVSHALDSILMRSDGRGPVERVLALRWSEHANRPETIPMRLNRETTSPEEAGAPPSATSSSAGDRSLTTSSAEGPLTYFSLLSDIEDRRITALTAYKQVYSFTLDALLSALRRECSHCSSGPSGQRTSLGQNCADAVHYAFGTNARPLIVTGPKSALPASRQLAILVKASRKPPAAASFGTVAAAQGASSDSTKQQLQSQYIVMRQTPHVRHGPTAALLLSPFASVSASCSGFCLLVANSDGSVSVL